MTRPTWIRRVVFALIASVVFGVALRVVMRIIGILSFGAEGFSWGGTIEVVLLGVIIGAPLALAFFVLRSRLKWPRPWAGVALGAALFAATAFRPPPAARSALAVTADPPLATAALFAALWIGYGLLLEYLHTRATLRSRQDEPAL